MAKFKNRAGAPAAPAPVAPACEPLNDNLLTQAEPVAPAVLAEIALSPQDAAIVALCGKVVSTVSRIRKTVPWVRGEISMPRRLTLMGAMAVCRQLLGSRDRPEDFPYQTLNELCGFTSTQKYFPSTRGLVPGTAPEEDRERRELETIDAGDDQKVMNLEALLQKVDSEDEDAAPEEERELPVATLAELLLERIVSARRHNDWLTGRINHERRLMINGAHVMLRQALGKTDRPKDFPFNHLDELILLADKSKAISNAIGTRPKGAKNRLL